MKKLARKRVRPGFVRRTRQLPHKMKQLLRIAAAMLGIAGLICIGIFFFKGAGAGKLAWDEPTVRKSLMTFAYKVYGDPAAQNGRYFLSKIAFHNDGSSPVHDFSISYQIPGYISWTTPETHSEIPPGQTIVQLYYPQLPSWVTQLTSQTTATLETKIHWSDKAGKSKEDILRSNVILRGRNEVEYTDLPANEVVTWYDAWATAPFTISMVTPNDPVVKEFVAEITKRTGGTQAGVTHSPKEIAQVMQATYDYMCETGMRYTSDQGVPATIGDVKTSIQTVRLPRDVITTNEGLCIELALLWASALQHLGLNPTVVFVPNHAFTVVQYGQGPNDIIPIECTAITPMAVGEKQPVSFNDAVEMASKELEYWKKAALIMPLDVEAYQEQGFRAPELPPIEIDKIKDILAQRSNHTAAAYATQAPSQNLNATPAPVRQGYHRWVGANGMISIDIPENWTRTENAPFPGMLFTAQDMQTTVAVEVFYYPTLHTPDEAMQARQHEVSRNGGRVKVANQQPKENTTYYAGSTSYRKGSTQWVGVFQGTSAGVIGFFAGADKGRFETNQPIISDLISSARFSAP